MEKSQEIHTTLGSSLPRTPRRKGVFQLRISKRGKPYVNISKIDTEALMAVSQEWEIRPDFANNPPFQILPAQTTTKGQDWEVDSLVTSIRVSKGEWDWFKNECRANGTSTCREIRKWIHLAREDAEFPQNLRRAPGPGHVQEYVR